MKRDFDLIRKILQEIESATPSPENNTLTINKIIDGYDLGDVNEHIGLLINEGFVKGKSVPGYQREDAAILGLTWSGHDLLNALNKKDWKKVESILKVAGSIIWQLYLHWPKT